MTRFDATTAKDESGMSAARENKRQINARVACYRLRIGRSKLHRYGVFALEDIPRAGV